VKFESLPKGVRLAVQAAQEKKAAGITVIDLSNAGAFTEYFVICTGYSTPQVQAICTEVEEQLYKHMRRSPEHREGHRSAEWALLDFGGFVLHVFSEQARRFYDLERLWRSSPMLAIPDEEEGVASTRTTPSAAFAREQLSGDASSRRPHGGRPRQ
jgi:ribosome-associated protein